MPIPPKLDTYTPKYILIKKPYRTPPIPIAQSMEKPQKMRLEVQKARIFKFPTGELTKVTTGHEPVTTHRLINNE